jgi:hypothetical protein
LVTDLDPNDIELQPYFLHSAQTEWLLIALQESKLREKKRESYWASGEKRKRDLLEQAREKQGYFFIFAVKLSWLHRILQ